MGNSNLKIKSTLNRLEVVNHLEQLVASLKAGTVCIRKGEKAVTLTPCDPVTFELEA
jgi:amphi-Trp domain-containing protein